MGVPKRRSSKSKIRSRKASHKKSLPTLRPCPKCGELSEPHRVCPACGTYNGRQVNIVSADE
jgi:large subunit ribosomal protein L32